MNYVLIFCNSTAGRLIYVHSHYNMCAGGGYMYQISNEKFGLFVTELRKEKNFPQEKSNGGAPTLLSSQTQMWK